MSKIILVSRFYLVFALFTVYIYPGVFAVGLEADNGVEILSTFKRHENLHRDFKVTWTVNFPTNTVEFEVSAKTKGYIGFGISHNGDMTGSDIVVGGLFDNGTSYFSDRHATGRFTPLLDQQQNWHLQSAKKVDDWTVLQFSRAFDTCDLSQDISITNDTQYIIWSLGKSHDLKKHIRYGSKQVNFLDPPTEEVDTSKFDTWKIEWNSAVPSDKDTAYWCTVHKSPIFTQKTHIVGLEVVLNTHAALAHTHHLVLRRCNAKSDRDWIAMMDSWIGHPGAVCFEKSDLSRAFGDCPHSFYVWAKVSPMF